MARREDGDEPTSVTPLQSLILASVSDRPLTKLLSSSKPVAFGARQLLFREGDNADSVFMLVQGNVRLSRHLPNGRRMVAAFVFPGEIFGLSFDEIYPF